MDLPTAYVSWESKLIMSKTSFERGKSLTYPRYYPKLTFTPIFGRRGDFVWVEEVKGAWPEHDSEFTFVRENVHDQRVDRLKEENERLRDYVYALSECKEKACLCEYCPHGRNDFDDDNAFIHCDFDFEQLKQDAGIE